LFVVLVPVIVLLNFQGWIPKKWTFFIFLHTSHRRRRDWRRRRRCKPRWIYESPTSTTRGGETETLAKPRHGWKRKNYFTFS